METQWSPRESPYGALPIETKRKSGFPEPGPIVNKLHALAHFAPFRRGDEPPGRVTGTEGGKVGKVDVRSTFVRRVRA